MGVAIRFLTYPLGKRRSIESLPVFHFSLQMPHDQRSLAKTQRHSACGEGHCSIEALGSGPAEACAQGS